MKKIVIVGVILFGMLMLLGSCGNDEEYDSYDDIPEEVDNDHDPADYDADGNYKPVDEMTDDEMEEELTGMIDDALND